VLRTTRMILCICLAASLWVPLFIIPGAVAAEDPCNELLCAGAASVDMTWHTGSGQGQYGSAGNGLTSGKFDPFHHQTKMVPSDGMQSRLFTKAIVVKAPDGEKVAFVKTELYLQQDILTRRVAELVSGADPLATDFRVDGLDGSRIMLGATHNHSAPEYVSTAWGVWLFTDSFDFRAYETTARKIAKAIKEADDSLQPAKIGASVSNFGDVQQNILGPATADDGTPAGFPRDHFDRELAVIRIDSLDGDPIAAWVNLGMHPESMATFNLISGDFVAMVERIVERGMERKPGADKRPVVAWSQGSVGDVEPDRERRAHPSSEKREYWHRDISQAERMSRDLSAAVLDTWGDVAEETPQVPEKFVPFSSDLEVGMVDYRFSGPPSHPLPTVSNCRTDQPAVPIVGLPDCERIPGTPEQLGTTIDLLQSAGVPVPHNAGTAPSYGAVQESATIHLQAMRLGDILVASCPCEPISDMVMNFKSRADAATGNLYLGYEWPCRPTGSGFECNFRTALHQSDSWRPVSTDAYQRMIAEIRNDASGWEEDFLHLQGEVEANDPAEIKGNYSHQDIHDLSCEGSCGYKLPIMVGQANDYVGYVVTYREYMRGDHYRKALTPFGPHTSDYINTRLVQMGAELKGGLAVDAGIPGVAVTPADELIQTAKTLTVGKGATVGLGAYEKFIPDDGGTPGKVISEPASLTRFGAATFTWEGGSNWTDNPLVELQRRNTDGFWEPYATQEGGEVIVTLEYEEASPTAALNWLQGGKVYLWTATFEAFEETAPGTYRFSVVGHHRQGRTANPYELKSEPFDVAVWDGIAAHDLTVDAATRSARFLADGVELSEPADQLETDDDAVLSGDEVHYPESYQSSLAYIQESYTTVDDHRYCWRCTFRPWANTGKVTSAQVTVMQSDGVDRTYPASFDGEGWTVSGLDLANDDIVIVKRGGVIDEFSNLNGKPSNAIGPLTGLTDRPVPTVLSYAGDTSGAVGSTIDVSAVLETSRGAPVSGVTITFKRGSQSANAVTGEDGLASGSLKIVGPPGSRTPIEVSFAGSGNYLPASLSVPFTASSPGKNAGAMAAALSSVALLVVLLLALALALAKRRAATIGGTA